MMNALLQDSQSLPKRDFVELRFETFEANPIEQLKKIYAQLELPDWERARAAFQQYLDAQKQYRKNQYAFPTETLEQVEAHWQPFIQRWNYAPPGKRA